VYSTCIFCHTSLGANEAIEQFPVGRRIAFDAAKGRLWVVCRRCARWNLSPLETRWEAIEECERLFSQTKLRISTDHIGLARARDGTDLVRIGEPKRPEMAAWRYGDRFARRRRRQIALSAVGITLPVVGAALAVGAPAVLLGFGAVGANLATLGFQLMRMRVRVLIRTAAGERLRLSRRGLQSVTLVRDAATEFGWAVRFQPRPAFPQAFLPGPGRDPLAARMLTGADAVSALRVALPAMNADGGSVELVRAQVGLLEHFDLPELLSQNDTIARGVEKLTGAPMRLAHSSFRWALEMALHEEDERRALEGELASLESRWREAEEISAVADDLLLPPGLRDKLERLKIERLK
jgi:hypothetical protein